MEMQDENKNDNVLNEEIQNQNIEENNVLEDTNENNVETESNDANEVNDNEVKLTNEEILNIEKILEEKTLEAATNNEKYMRTLAEYDNFRKRTQKEKSDMYDKGIMDTVLGFLEIIDNFDRALSGIQVEELDEKNKSLYDGITMIRKQFDKTLDNIGVKPIEAVGCEFNPNVHNAVTHAEDENLGENMVAEEFQKGYIYNDKVIRYSMVKVVN